MRRSRIALMLIACAATVGFAASAYSFDLERPWSATNVSVPHGSSSDALSGVARFEYRQRNTLDNPDDGFGPWLSGWLNLPIGSTATVTHEGHTEVAIRAVDVATNVGPEARVLVRIDRTGPVVDQPPTGDPARSWEDGEPGIVRVTPGYDLPRFGSGIDRYQHQFVSAAADTFTGAPVREGDEATLLPGSWFVRFRAIDNVGNVGDWGPPMIFSWKEKNPPDRGTPGELEASIDRSWGEDMTDALCNLPDINGVYEGTTQCDSGARTWGVK